VPREHVECLRRLGRNFALVARLDRAEVLPILPKKSRRASEPSLQSLGAIDDEIIMRTIFKRLV
jgi:hypothetical protein